VRPRKRSRSARARPSREEEEEEAGGDRGGRRERALHERLYLLERRSRDTFAVLGATGNVYDVALSEAPSCSCMDFRFRGRTARCKHIMFVLIRVLGASPHDDDTAGCVAPRRIPRERLAALLAEPAHRAAAAAPHIVARYEALVRGEAVAELPPRDIDEETNVCAICYEELLPELAPGGGAAVGAPPAALAHCRFGCGRSLHAACVAHWAAARRRAREPVTCVFCRAPWEPPPARSKLPRGEYINILEAMGKHAT
jgi:hypothetical protein